jgi:hypothetical protein
VPYGRGLKLGKKPGAVHDTRTLHLASLLGPDLPPAPKTWRIATSVHDWGMLGNDRYGDCGFASLAGHRVIAQEYSARNPDAAGRPTTDQVLSAYFDCTGGIDSGIYLIDGLRYMRTKGAGREADQTTHTITAYAKVDHTDLEQVRAAAKLFGGLYLGLALPIAAERELDAGKPWATTTGPDTDPYSWGGHATWMIQYDERRMKVATWGSEQWMTTAWWRTYVDEAWCVISEDQFTRLGKTPQGLNVTALQEYLARLG